MATLNTYWQATQRFLRDQRQDLLNPGDILSYINQARREVAMRAQCIRRLTPISGAIISVTVTAGGSGYSATPTITITTPDFPSGDGPFPGGAQATASAIVMGGVITAIDVTYGGAGYFQPVIRITDTTGSGATATAALSFLNQLNENQEAYPFSAVDLSMFPGVDSIYMVQSVSLLWSNFRYSLPVYSFSTYQALIRNWSQQSTFVPAVCAQYGQGVDGSFYMFPLPSQAYQMEWDCLCLPQDLATNQSDEAIPAPWTEAVPYFAAYLCYLELQNFNAARFYEDQFDKRILRYSQYARPGRATTYYGRY